MADSTTITFDDDGYNDGPDDDGINGNEEFDTDFDFGYNVDSAAPDAPMFTADTPLGGIKDKKDIEKVVKEQVESALAQKKKELRKQMRRSDQDLKKQRVRQKRADIREAAQRRKAIRSQASANRASAYSAAAAFGLPGYLASTVLDKFFFRPEEERDIANEEQYMADLDSYNNSYEDQLTERRRAFEDYIDNLKEGGEGDPDFDFTPPKQGKKPTRKAPGKLGAGIGAAANAVTAIVPIAQQVVSTIDSVGHSMQSSIKSSFGNDPLAAMRQNTKTAQKLYDPLGVNIPLQIGVTGFETLLSLTEEIRDYSKKDLVFSPGALTANIEGSIEKMMKSIEIAQRLDPTKESMNRIWTEFEIQWMEFKAYLIELFGPFVIANMRLIIELLKAAKTGISVGWYAWMAQLGWVGLVLDGMLKALGVIAGNTKPPLKNGISPNLMSKINSAMNPTIQQQRMQQQFPGFNW